MAPVLRRIVEIAGTQRFSRVSIRPHNKSIRNFLYSVFGFYWKAFIDFLFRIKFSIEWYVKQLWKRVYVLAKMNDYFIYRRSNRTYMGEYQGTGKVRPITLKLTEMTTDYGPYNCWKFHVKLPLISNWAEFNPKRSPSFCWRLDWRRFFTCCTFGWILYLCRKKTKPSKWSNLGKKYRRH